MYSMGPDPSREEALLRGTCAGALWRIYTWVYCATAGECACPAHAANEYIRRREEWQDKTAMRPLAKLLWTLVMEETGGNRMCEHHAGQSTVLHKNDTVTCHLVQLCMAVSFLDWWRGLQRDIRPCPCRVSVSSQAPLHKCRTSSDIYR